MKYSNYIGVGTAVLIIGVCFAPWVYIESIGTTVTGLKTNNTNFGMPGLIHIISCIIASVLFIVPAVWAKRINVFACALNFAWSGRNYLLITQCELGECPEKRWGIYVLLMLSVIMLIFSFVPQTNFKNSDR